MRAAHLPLTAVCWLLILVQPGTAEDAYYPPAEHPDIPLSAEPPPPPPPVKGYGLPVLHDIIHNHHPQPPVKAYGLSGVHDVTYSHHPELPLTAELPSRYSLGAGHDTRHSHHTDGYDHSSSSIPALFRGSGGSSSDGYIVEGISTPGTSLGGFGGPPPGPVPPIPPPGPLVPPGPCSPAGFIWMRLYTLVEPVVVLVIGVSIFVVVKHLVIPYMLYIARHALYLEDRAMHRSVTEGIIRAATKGLCLDRISCQLGQTARGYTLTNAVVSALKESDELPELFGIFRDAASGQLDTCEPYACYRKSSSSHSAGVKKLSHWKRKSNTTSEIRR